MSILKHLKNAPTCFDHHSDHLQGARMFLVKVTKFKNLNIFISFLKLGRLFLVMRKHNVWCVCVAYCVERCADQHTSPHRTPRTHTKRYAAALPQITSPILKKNL